MKYTEGEFEIRLNGKKLEGVESIEYDLFNVSDFLPKRHNHDHFWIEDGVLYESYKTIRGMRYNQTMEVSGMPNEEKCSDACLKYIAKEYCR